MANAPTPVQDRTRQILRDLDAVRENLLGLSDDIWLSIDHNDTEAMEEGVKFKRAYNEKVAAFDQVAAELSALVQRQTRVWLAAEEETGVEDRESNERLIRELDRETPHGISEDFTYKRPYGFILDGQAAVGVTTWRRLFELFCGRLLARDPERFRALPSDPKFLSKQGHRDFSRKPDELRVAGLIGDGVYAEVHYSANSLRDIIRRLLATFEIPEEKLQVFLREDRDAQQ